MRITFLTRSCLYFCSIFDRRLCTDTRSPLTSSWDHDFDNYFNFDTSLLNNPLSEERSNLGDFTISVESIFLCNVTRATSFCSPAIKGPEAAFFLFLCTRLTFNSSEMLSSLSLLSTTTSGFPRRFLRRLLYMLRRERWVT